MECALSIRTHKSLLISGGTNLASMYKSSALVGFRYPVIALHAGLSSGSRRCVCFDLDHTAAAYSATEYHKAIAVVLIVLAFVPHLEFVSFLRTLCRVATFIYLLCMCSL